jgi:site-specific DNA-methyltransferase (adenine-specific)
MITLIKGDWDKEVPTAEYFNELFRVTKHQIIFGIEYFNLTSIGIGRIKWNKLVPEGMSFKKYEMAYCSLIDNTYEFDLLWAGMQQAKSFLEPSTHQANKQLNEKRIHPCHKPIMLYKHLLSRYAKEGDTILDTHLGSGSSAIACIDGGFDFTGIELDSDYFDAMRNRVQNHVNQLDLFISRPEIKIIENKFAL